MRKITMQQTREVLRLYLLANLSSRKIQGATGVARTTVQDYIKRCNASDISSVEILDSLNDDALNEKLFGIPLTQTSKPSKILPDYNKVHQEMKRKKKTKVTLMLLWEEYKRTYKDEAYEYTQFRVYYKRYRQKLNPSMRQVHLAGEKVFVDYSGITIPIYNQKTGEVDTAQIFVAVLGASGYTYVHATHSQKQEDFILSHVEAYQFFGGVPEVVVPDNLKSAIISNNKNGIIINDFYAALARFYSMRIEPARPRKPKDKPKAEQGVQGIQRYILACFRHTKFFSVDDLNDAISDLLDRYNNKVMKHIEKSRYELFIEIEKDELQAFPANR
ncbi:IS21 family transposase [Sulfurimonas sp. SAG-AH-194-I05]|nr:IS21 family transposase [Sulfurimonas sp. SAG-AH-194-I05]MDF1875632.1 IS21 family transposase [Sulfurimonas sp. SAG-AH-194-I05]